MANDARSKMTQNNNKYRKIRINGREFRLVPRSDGRFNLMAEGQRGAAGSTAIVGRREGKKLLQKLKALETAEFPAGEKDSEVVSFEAYMEDDENTVVELDAEFDNYEKNDPTVDETYPGWAVEDSNPVEPVVMSENKEVEVFTYESDETSDRFVSDELVVSYPPGTIEKYDGEVSDKTLYDGEVSFADERFVPEELKEKYRKNEKITFSDWAAAVTVAGGSAVFRYADRKGTNLHNYIMEKNLTKLRSDLSEIKAAAKYDLAGAPLAIVTGGAVGLTTKALKAHNANIRKEEQLNKIKDNAELSFYKRENQRAWGMSQAMKADDFLDQKMPPLQEELKNINESVEKHKEYTRRIRIMEAHPIFNLTDEMLAEERRKAAENRDVEKLAELKGLETRRNAARKMYTTMTEEYKKMPTIPELNLQARETKTKMKTVLTEAQRIKNTKLDRNEFDRNTTPYSVDDEKTMRKINLMRAQTLADSLRFALFRGERVLSKRNRYLRMSYEKV